MIKRFEQKFWTTDDGMIDQPEKYSPYSRHRIGNKKLFEDMEHGNSKLLLLGENGTDVNFNLYLSLVSLV